MKQSLKEIWKMLALSKCNSMSSNVQYFLILLLLLPLIRYCFEQVLVCNKTIWNSLCWSKNLQCFPTEFILWSWQFSKEVHNTTIGKHWPTYLCLFRVLDTALDLDGGHLAGLPRAVGNVWLLVASPPPSLCPFLKRWWPKGSETLKILCPKS